MKRAETLGDKRSAEKHVASFAPVLDTRKRKIPGLWRRGARYYVQLRVDLSNGRTTRADWRWMPPTSRRQGRTGTQAHRASGQQAAPDRHRPRFDDFACEYLDGPTRRKKSGQQTQLGHGLQVGGLSGGQQQFTPKRRVDLGVSRLIHSQACG